MSTRAHKDHIIPCCDALGVRFAACKRLIKGELRRKCDSSPADRSSLLPEYFKK